MVAQRSFDEHYGFTGGDRDGNRARPTPRATARVAAPPTHDWVEDFCMGRLHVCTRCPAVWWPHLTPPREACVPASSTSADSAAPQGEEA